jgi:S1-C subfamily serine protease
VAALVAVSSVVSPSERAGAAFAGGNGLVVFAAAPSAGQQHDLYTVAPDGRREALLVRNGVNPKWSWNGRRVAFVRDGDIYVKRLYAKRLVRLTRDARDERNPSWSPDDEWIAFARSVGGRRDGSGNYDVYVVPTDASRSPKVLVGGPGTQKGPAWSPDGKWLAFETNGQIGVASPDGRTVRALTTSGENVSPAWAPDGKSIAFAGRSAGGNWDVFVVDAGGATTPRNVTSNPAVDLDPTWSPDGKQIAFTSNRSGTYAIHATSASGRETRELTGTSRFSTTSDWKRADPATSAELRKRIETGVVRLVAHASDGSSASGTGFLIGPCLIVTARHVVAEAETVVASKGAQRIGGRITVVRSDKQRDIALLRPAKPLKGWYFDFTPRRPSVQEDVAVLGYPRRRSLVMQGGTITSLDQVHERDDGRLVRGLLQFSARAEPGQSGGPLVRVPTEAFQDPGDVLGLVITTAREGDATLAVPAHVVNSFAARWRGSPMPIGSTGCQR